MFRQYYSLKNILSKLQEFLPSRTIFTEASRILAILVIFIIISEIALAVTLTLLKKNISWKISGVDGTVCIKNKHL